MFFCFSVGCMDGFYGRNCTFRCSYPSFGLDCKLKCICSSEECHHAYGCRRTPSLDITEAAPKSTNIHHMDNMFTEEKGDVYESKSTSFIAGIISLLIVAGLLLVVYAMTYLHKVNCIVQGDTAKCTDGFYGRNCTTPCPKPYFGSACLLKCMCSSENCHHVYGCKRIPSECATGKYSEYCELSCRYPNYGNRCQLVCPCDEAFCDPSSGCEGCVDGFNGRNCTFPCQYPTFGLKCCSTCNCSREDCHHVYGCSQSEAAPKPINISHTDGIHT
ncbi:multiple epidermal growth factor-like domains protein 6 [Ostrea edulis]|uniref:multiple epidermal growth factor-like domains protein 6 n=1 Tax=Ostrea edulis TaxID=37623 RepID=UPI0024AF07E9|nr:multiple epidermal growth factor-like domains protein 6 [Ostrea edulis]